MKTQGMGQEEAMQERMNKVQTMRRLKTWPEAHNAVAEGKAYDQLHGSPKEGIQA